MLSPFCTAAEQHIDRITSANDGVHETILYPNGYTGANGANMLKEL